MRKSIIDNENKSMNFKKRILKKNSKYEINRKITKSEYITIWDKNFEFDNFTDKEIANAMTKQSKERYIFKEDDVDIARQENSSLQKLYKDKAEHDLDKRELAKDLTDIIINEMDSTVEKKAKREKRKIIEEILKITNIAQQNYFPTYKKLWKINQESGFFGDLNK